VEEIGVAYCKTTVSLKVLSECINNLSQNSLFGGLSSNPVISGKEAVILFGHYLK
jgi:hypothetical protein